MARLFRSLSFLVLTLGCWITSRSQETVTPKTALESYIQQKDKAYAWQLQDSILTDSTVNYRLLLTSQQWHGYTWTHQLTLIVPKSLVYHDALLFVSGGSNKDGVPNWTGNGDELISSLTHIAQRNKACVALLKQVPNQPLFGDLTEDALISYTLHQFQRDHDYSWPLLFPMVKSAVKAMDAIQEFSGKHTATQIEKFLISGLSKRGWTTWLTGAADKRVKAIAPMVIDVLNMSVSLDYQVQTWHDYSIQIQDYVKLGIAQQVRNEEGSRLLQMIDPYSYREKLTMPKMIFMGGNDPYWVIDNIKNYYRQIPGTNLLHYVPNAGHNLGDGIQAFKALNAFFAYTLQNQPYPVFNWKLEEKEGKALLTIDSNLHNLRGLRIWEASSNDADIRNNVWLFRTVKYNKQEPVSVDVEIPKKGYKAFYAALFFPDPTGGSYSQATRVFLLDSLGLIDGAIGHLQQTLDHLAKPLGKKVLVTSHRGLHHQVPENSLAAIEEAIRAGVDIVEIDVKVSKDGIPFLMHDQKIDRTTTGTGDAEQFLIKDLRSLRLKQEDQVTSYQIPTLEEALLLAKGRIVLDLDLKTDRMAPVLSLIEKTETTQQVIFFDSDTNTLRTTRKQIPTAKLMPRAHNFTEAKKAFDLNPTIVHIDEQCYTPQVVNLIKTKGARIWINALGDLDKHLFQGGEQEQLDKLLQKGANILQTDQPELLIHYLSTKGLR